jgi:hypothetical protein
MFLRRDWKWFALFVRELESWLRSAIGMLHFELLSQ